MKSRPAKGVDLRVGNGKPKLTRSQVEDVRRQVSQGLSTQADLARRLGVTRQTINDIVKGRSWA